MSRIYKFYVISIGYSWVVWVGGTLFFSDVLTSTLLVSLGGIGPLLGVAYYVIGQKGFSFKDYLKRFKIHRHYGYIIMSLLLPVFVVLLSFLFSNQSIGFEATFLETWFISVIFLVFFGPLPEEMAWRGIAFHELEKHGYMRAQMIVAGLWLVWHIPLFFMRGTYQADLGILTMDGGLFLFNILSLSIITGFIYQKTHSITIAILFHYMVNLSGEMFAYSMTLGIYRSLIYIAIACLCFFVDLSKHKEKYHFIPLDIKTIKIIEKWQYNGYIKKIDMSAYHKHYEEEGVIKGPSKCDGFAVYRNKELVGLFEFYLKDDIIEIGLALHPSRIGTGISTSFINGGIHFGKRHYNPIHPYVYLRVDSENKAAYNAYLKAGFEIDSKESDEEIIMKKRFE